MRFTKHVFNIPIRNVDKSTTCTKMRTKRHSVLLPDSIRCIIAGPSNCGKTNLLIGMIESEHGLKFENIYIYSKSLEQDKYKYLRKLFSPMKHIGFHTFTSSEKVITPSAAKKNSIIIFDDVICDKNQENIKQYYCLVNVCKSEQAFDTRQLQFSNLVPARRYEFETCL